MYYWVALNFVQGVGSIKYKALISHFGAPENVFKADVGELCEVDGIGKKLADSIKSFDGFKEVEDELNSAKRKNVNIVHYLEYPQSLKVIKGAPPVLYVKGDLSLNDSNSFSIVGARKASIEKLVFAEEIGYKLAVNGVTVVSGMAVGIDAAAHKGALKASGKTVAVLGCGVDVIYPYSNKDIYAKIAESGAVVSGFRLGTAPARENFPQRNRIISGLSKGVLVVEANINSGSLITADYAFRQGKKVFAVPGNIKKETAKGANSLIKRGALLLDSVDDIFNNIVFDSTIKNKAFTDDSVEVLPTGLSESELEIYRIIKDEEAMHIDEIGRESVSLLPKVAGVLLNLELKGYIKQFSGKMFIRVNKLTA